VLPRQHAARRETYAAWYNTCSSSSSSSSSSRRVGGEQCDQYRQQGMLQGSLPCCHTMKAWGVVQ